MGGKEHEPFQFTFNGCLKVDFQGSRVTSDAGLLLVRELDERLGLATFIAEHLSDSRHGLNTQFRLADLLRQSVYRSVFGAFQNFVAVTHYRLGRTICQQQPDRTPRPA